MDGKRWIPTGRQLSIEQMTDVELQRRHLGYLNQFTALDLWKDHSDEHCYIMMELLGAELRIRMAAE